MPEPELREDEVLVQVHAAGVNLLDSKIRNGEFKLILPYRLPLTLGHDVAGVVVRGGPLLIRQAMREWSEPLKWHTELGTVSGRGNEDEEEAILPEISANSCRAHGDL